MKVRFKVVGLLCLLALAAAWYFWPRAGRTVASQSPAAPASVVATTAPASSAATATNLSAADSETGRSAASTNRLTFRLSNTSKSLTELSGDSHAILMENAFIDT